MKKIPALVIVVLFLSVTVIYPEGQSETGFADDTASFEVTDSLNRSVSLNRFPERIIQTGSSAFIITNTLYLFEEASDRVVGTSGTDQGMGFFVGDIDSGFDEKTIYSRNVGVEEILSVSPELVILKDFLAGKMEQELEGLGIPALFMNLETPDSFYSEIEILGRVFGNKTRADEIISWYKGQMDSIAGKLEDLTPDEKHETLLLYYNVKDGISSFSVPPLNWIQTDMVARAGGIPVWKDEELGERWTRVGLEQIAVWDPEYVIIISYREPGKDVVERVLSDPTWKTLRSVREGKIFAFPNDYHSWDQPDPRWILGYRWMAGILQEDRLSSDSETMEMEARRFFQFAYNLESDDFDRLILPRLSGGWN